MSYSKKDEAHTAHQGLCGWLVCGILRDKEGLKLS
jgi:hypothetical protein